MNYNRKKYTNSGKTLKWGESLSMEVMTRLKNGEVFILLDENGKPFSEVLMDSYDVIREMQIKP